MKQYLLLICFAGFINIVLGQESAKVYLAKGYDNATYVINTYDVKTKKHWKTYTTKQPETSTGTITQNGNYFILTEYRNGNKTNF